jgi:predicted dehydrogenase
MNKTIIVGAGRMGMRHAMGAVKVPEINEVCLVDMNVETLENARKEFSNTPYSNKVSYMTLGDFQASKRNDFRIAIIATTASNRMETVQQCLKVGTKMFLIEKTLGQSLQAVKELISYLNSHAEYAAVNLNMRQYPGFSKLRNDLETLPQLQGSKVLTLNSGTVGIGANGIHYLDLLLFLFNAHHAEVAAAEVEDTLIPSGRGPQFKDFGGWCTIKLYDANNNYRGRAHLSLSSTSTVVGDWDIVAPNGRILINEIQQKRTDYFRKADSTMPVNRYAADYLPPSESSFDAPFLGDLTQKWLEGVVKGERILPSIEESLKVHELMFSWLSHSKNFKDTFPIT